MIGVEYGVDLGQSEDENDPSEELKRLQAELATVRTELERVLKENQALRTALGEGQSRERMRSVSASDNTCQGYEGGSAN
jgi:cell shape-determining protein MreC